MNLLKVLLSLALYSSFALLYGSSNVAVLEDLRGCLESLNFERGNRSWCYTNEETQTCFGLPEVCKVNAETPATEVPFSFDGNVFHDRASQELCIKRPPTVHEYGLEEGEVTLLNASVTLDREWLLPISLQLSCIFIEKTGNWDQQCCVYLQDFIDENAAYLSCQGSLLIPAVGTKLKFRCDRILMSKLTDTKTNTMKQSVLDSSSKAYLLDEISGLIGASQSSFMEKLYKVFETYGLKAFLPPVLIIGFFLVIFCSRRLWGPVLMDKLPWLDRCLHPNRLEARASKNCSSVGSFNNYEIPEELNLFGDMVEMQPPEVAEEAFNFNDAIGVEIQVNNEDLNIANEENQSNLGNQVPNDQLVNGDGAEIVNDNIVPQNDDHTQRNDVVDDMDINEIVEPAPPYEEQFFDDERNEIEVDILGSGENLNEDASVV